MRLFVPYTKIEEATRHALTAYPDTVEVDVSGDDGAYQDYLQQRWDDGEPFINLEHDVLPWPGAVEALADCAADWCLYGYSARDDARAGMAPLGLVKFTAAFMAAIPDVWRDYGAQIGRAWGGCDSYLFGYATSRGIYPHQHFPAVLNTKPLVN